VGNLPGRGVEMIWIEMRADGHRRATFVSSINTNGVMILTEMRVLHVRNNFLKLMVTASNSTLLKVRA
jgi:hypothetical protein